MGQSSSAVTEKDDSDGGARQQQRPQCSQPPLQEQTTYQPAAKPVPTFLSAQQRLLTDALASTILTALPPAYQSCGKKTQWLQLYNSNTNGKSFQRFIQNIEEKGPTVIVIQIKNSSRILGAFCDSDWLTVAAREKRAVSNAAAKQRASRERQNTNGLYQKPPNQNNVFFGEEPCFVFCAGGEGTEKVDDSGVVYRSHNYANSNFMYLFDTHPQDDKIGIGMGGQPGYFGWFMDRWLEGGESMGTKCTTFQNPRLSETEKWEVGIVEAYAVKPDSIEKILHEQGGRQSGDHSVLRENADRTADKMLLELHGIHNFNANERPDV